VDDNDRRQSAIHMAIANYFAAVIGARIVRHGRSIIFQMAEVMAPRDLFRRILERSIGCGPSRRFDAENAFWNERLEIPSGDARLYRQSESQNGRV
jgi:hypothetical protein